MGFYRQKFEEEEEENKKVEEKFELKKRMALIEQERIEKQKEIRETFKSIIIEDNELANMDETKNQEQGTFLQ